MNKAHNSQSSRRITKTATSLLFGSVTLVLVGVLLSSASVISWLQTVYLLGYIKTFLGLVKYAPQALLNYRRKSTEGFAVGMMIFDLIGGSASLLQMVFIAVNNDDPASLTGNPGKLGTGVVTVVFEIIFLVQKYLVYPTNKLGPGPGYEPI